jgi:uncharacterized protein (DUF1778 family)
MSRKSNRTARFETRIATETHILNRTNVTIPAGDWESFEAWLNRPAQMNAGLAELARRVPSWER